VARPRLGLLGAAGYIAPRHLDAIHASGGELVLACDPSDSVGVLDRHGTHVRFTREDSEFSTLLRRRNQGVPAEAVEYVAICSPNHLHLAHCRLALEAGAHAICEKPLVLTPTALDELERLEAQSRRRVFTILQLRAHERLRMLRQRLLAGSRRDHDVTLTYLTPRGPWYQASWKGESEKSGGIASNIGIHLFDLLLWLFGPAARQAVHLSDAQRMAGTLELERASVRWFLSVDPRDAARAQNDDKPGTRRTLIIDGERHDFSDGFGELHTNVYREILRGDGLGIRDARPSIELTHRLKGLEPSAPGANAHPLCVG